MTLVDPNEADAKALRDMTTDIGTAWAEANGAASPILAGVGTTAAERDRAGDRRTAVWLTRLFPFPTSSGPDGSHVRISRSSSPGSSSSR
jgi:hypothetical protein